ncbi:hypothetical protein, partial [Limnospira platensis]
MSQSSQIQATSSPPQLQPVLQSVLESLDVKLEQELTRYRRYRRQSQSDNQQPRESSNSQSPSFPGAIAPNAITPELPPTQTEPQRPPTGWESVLLPEPAPIVPHNQNQTTANGNGSAAETSSATSPLGYLESTEKLISSIEKRAEYRKQRQSKSWTKRLFTPLGMVSMLLLFISSAILGYVVTGGAGLQILGFNRLFRDSQTPTSEPIDTNTVEPTSPNLATQEFVELDLNTLSTINPNPNLPTTAPQGTPIDGGATVPPAPSPSVVIPTGPGLNNLSQELLPQPVAPAPAPAP